MSATLARRLARAAAALVVAASAGSAQVTAGTDVVAGPAYPATTFTTTPEPATLALIALGLLSMAGAERTRRRARR